MEFLPALAALLLWGLYTGTVQRTATAMKRPAMYTGVSILAALIAWAGWTALITLVRIAIWR